MEFDFDGFAEATRTAYAALGAGGTDVPADAARSIAADLFADAVFSAPFDTWMSGRYRAALTVPVAVLERRLSRVASSDTREMGHVLRAAVQRRSDVFVDGTPAHRHVDGFHATFALATSILHLEWHAYVAAHSGIDAPDALVTRCREESLRYSTGRAASLSPDVRRFQRLLFRDAEWVASDRPGVRTGERAVLPPGATSRPGVRALCG